MSISNKALLTSQATGGKPNALLANLIADSGVGTRLGASFSKILNDTVSSQPAPPPQRASEAERPKEPDRQASRSEHSDRAESKREAAERVEAQAERRGSDEARAASDRVSAEASDDSTAQTPASKSAESGKGDESLTADKRGAAKPADKLAANRANAEEMDAIEVTDATVPSPDIGLVAIAAAEPSRLQLDDAGPSKQSNPALATDDTKGSDKVAPESLASLLPTVTQAVFGSVSRASTAATGRSEARAASPTTTGERAEALSAKAQEANVLARAELLAAPTATSDTPSDKSLKELGAFPLELSKALGGDKPSAGVAPGVGNLLHAAAAVSGAVGASAAHAPARAAAQDAQVPINSHLRSAGFAPEMAARLTLLAGEGVQRAELRLNPVEMGPVSVHLRLDGQQAQVEFHAQHAMTREVLERSLPELASALRDAGLTLSGGGVFQQPQDAKQDPHARAMNGPAQGPSEDFGGGEQTPSATTRRTEVGVLDTYA
ncbi:MAG TPA: hypothetical protein DIC36_09605 [Gammaproteobacteria bacterium]|nr:hypothetical protein [Gammaproteobacteria bacterium]